MAKYNERLVQKIVRLIEEDTYTIGEICDSLGVSRNSFYEWKREKPEFARAIQDAEDRRDDALAALARNSLRKRIEGYTVCETKVTYEPYASDASQFKMKKKEMKEKHFPPDTKAIKLALERQDRKREKEEAKNSSPERRPIVIKVPQNVDPEEVIDIHRKFIETVNSTGKRWCDEKDEDEVNYRTVVI